MRRLAPASSAPIAAFGGVDFLHPYGVDILHPMNEPRGLSRLELLQGTLDMIVLQTLRWGPRHGYGIAQMVKANSANALQVDTGSLYPALHRLERHKLIVAEWDTSENGQRVRVYKLTAAGRRHLVNEKSRWEQLTNAIAAILTEPAEGET